MKFESVKPGMRLMDIHKTRMGNTTMREWGLWYVYIVSVDEARRTAKVVWNGNPARTWSARELAKLKTKPTKAYLEQQERRARLR